MTRSEHPLRLYMRPECGLCEDMAAELVRLRLPFVTINVENDEGLEAAYGEVIPVLMDGDREIARAPQTRASLEKLLRRSGVLR